ncbi:secreted RxLR effector protein 161-like [Arachis duranensis]|uniref:Secreted RxLR effector protein 161-like n=1 Tax=Arachis duranensis TaxID=130453 RepID=A0A6P4C538_ARADU|nr:secreted RxLR effector protein 161-like [Arachis duranensis]
MLAAKSATTPMNYSSQLSKSIGTRLETNIEYRRLIGCLLYLANTRSEISYAFNKLSQFLECLTDKHFEACLRVLRYLKSSPARGLFFSTKSNLKVIGYSDSDWAACPDSRRPVTSYCFFLRISLITWKSNKQNVVTTSSAKAEYKALAASTCEAQWICFIMNELKFPPMKPIAIYCDSQTALYIAANSMFHEKTKYIEADCHIVCDKAKEQVIKLLPIKFAEQAADILIKALIPKLFNSCHRKFRLLNIHAPDLRKGVT